MMGFFFLAQGSFIAHNVCSEKILGVFQKMKPGEGQALALLLESAHP